MRWSQQVQYVDIDMLPARKLLAEAGISMVQAFSQGGISNYGMDS
jgi:hypothetical protein